MKKFLCCVKGETSNPVPDIRDLPGVNFGWQDILDGTENLRRTNHLGKGSFGDVYRCNLPGISEGTSQVGAAKIQKDIVYADVHPEFVAEITTLHEANHPNVIKLLGKCIEGDCSVIIYEFMPNGSLDQHLYARKKPDSDLPPKHPVLEWDTRVKIAVGVAEALVYIHQQLKVLHLDVKDANVLLDENLVPKLTDFGLATKIVEGRNSVERRKRIDPIKGTLGFVAPETQLGGTVTTKSDVYSYGVFLLTLITGRKGYDRERPVGEMKIVEWIKRHCSSEENLPQVIDAELGERYPIEGLQILFYAARMCIREEEHERPDMGTVEQVVREALDFPVSTPLTEDRASV